MNYPVATMDPSEPAPLHILPQEYYPAVAVNYLHQARSLLVISLVQGNPIRLLS